MIHKAEASIAAGRANTSYPLLHVAGPCVRRVTNNPLGAVTIRIWKARGQPLQNGKYGLPQCPVSGHLKHIFPSQPAKGSLQLNTSKQHSQANTHQSQWQTAAGREGQGEKGRSLQSSTPNLCHWLPLLPISPWALMWGRGTIGWGWGEHTRTAKQNTTGLASASPLNPPRRNTLIVTSIDENL